MWNKDTKTYIDAKYVLADADQFVKFSLKEINELTFSKIPCLLVKNLQAILFNHTKFIEFLKANTKSTGNLACLMDAFKSIHNLDDKKMEHFYSYLNNLKAIEDLFQANPQLVQIAPDTSQVNYKDLEFIYAKAGDDFPRTVIYKGKYKVIRSNFVYLLKFIYKAKAQIQWYETNQQLAYCSYDSKTKRPSRYSSHANIGRYDPVEKALTIGCEKIPLNVLEHIVKVFHLPESS